MADRREGERAGGLLRWGMALVGFGIVERIGLAWAYQPVSYGDTPTYFRLAAVLTDAGLDGYDATRVPGYPLFIGVLGQNETTVWIVQLVLGVLISLLVTYICWRLTAIPWLSIAAGFAYDLIAGQVLFESALLSETLTTFLLLAAVAGSLRLMGRGRPPSRVLVAAVGAAASLAAMTRTLFFILPVVLLPFVVLSADRWAERVNLAIAFSLPPLLIMGGWLGFVYQHYGMLSPTTMGGYHLIQHTGAFFEYLPQDEAVIRDTYLAYRQQQIAERGTQTNTIWEAIPELSERTGLSFFALSEKLQELSLELIVAHPARYLSSVVQGWIWFWKAPVYWQPDKMNPAIASLVAGWAWVGRGASVLANAAFLALTAGLALSRRLRDRLRPTASVTMLISLVVLASVVQTLVDHGDNPRFLMPLQMLVLVIVLWAAQRGWQSYRAKRVPA